MKQALPVIRGTQPQVVNTVSESAVFVGVSSDCPGMSRLADSLEAQAFLPDRIALQEVLDTSARKLTIILPVNLPSLVYAASRHPKVHRLGVYHSPQGPHPRWKRALIRAAFALADQTIIASDDAMLDAVRAGADPDRIIIGFDHLSRRLAEEEPRREMKEAFVSLAIDAIDTFGIISTLERIAPDKGINVVNYHRVLPTAEHRQYGRPQMAMAAPLFEIQMETFAKNGGFVELSELRDDTRKGRTAVTFDDGYEDNHRVALDSLKRWSVPACIYLVTQQVDQAQPLWWDQVGQALHSLWLDTNTEALLDPRLPPRVHALADVSSPLRARDLISEILGDLNDSSEDERQRLQNILKKLSNVSPQQTMLSWAQIKAMSEYGIHFGSHTQNHICLDEVPQAHARREVMNAQSDLEKELGTLARKSVALPRGKLGPFTEDSLREAGFDSVMTTIAGVNKFSDDSLFILRRDGKMLTLRGRHHPAKMRLELTGWLDRVRNALS